MLEVLIVLIIAFAFFVEASIGFGAGLLSIPFLAVLIGLGDAVLLVLLFQFCMGFLVFFNLKSVNRKIIKQIFIGLVLGSAAGILLQNYLPQNLLMLFLGLFILLYVTQSVLKKELFRVLLDKIPDSGIGTIGSLVQGAFGVGGPVFVIYFNHMNLEKHAFRATFIATFFTCNVVRLLTAYSSNLYSWTIFQYAAWALLPFVAALYMGQKYHNKIDQKIFDIILNGLLFISALSLIYKAVLNF